MDCKLLKSQYITFGIKIASKQGEWRPMTALLVITTFAIALGIDWYRTHHHQH